MSVQLFGYQKQLKWIKASALLAIATLIASCDAGFMPKGTATISHQDNSLLTTVQGFKELPKNARSATHIGALEIGYDMSDQLGVDLTNSGMALTQAQVIVDSAKENVSTTVGALVIPTADDGSFSLTGVAKRIGVALGLTEDTSTVDLNDFKPSVIAGPAVIVGAYTGMAKPEAGLNTPELKLSVASLSMSSGLKALNGKTSDLDDAGTDKLFSKMVEGGLSGLQKAEIPLESAPDGIEAVTSAATAGITSIGVAEEKVVNFAGTILEAAVESSDQLIASAPEEQKQTLFENIVGKATKGTLSKLKEKAKASGSSQAFSANAGKVAARALKGIKSLQTKTGQTDSSVTNNSLKVLASESTKVTSALIKEENLDATSLKEMTSVLVSSLDEAAFSKEEIGASAGSITSGAMQGAYSVQTAEEIASSGLMKELMGATVESLGQTNLTPQEMASSLGDVVAGPLEDLKKINLADSTSTSNVVDSLIEGMVGKMDEAGMNEVSVVEVALQKATKAVAPALKAANFEASEIADMSGLVAKTTIEASKDIEFAGTTDKATIFKGLASEVTKGTMAGMGELVSDGFVDESFVETNATNVLDQTMGAFKTLRDSGDATLAFEASDIAKISGGVVDGIFLGLATGAGETNDFTAIKDSLNTAIQDDFTDFGLSSSEIAAFDDQINTSVTKATTLASNLDDFDTGFEACVDILPVAMTDADYFKTVQGLPEPMFCRPDQALLCPAPRFSETLDVNWNPIDLKGDGRILCEGFLFFKTALTTADGDPTIDPATGVATDPAASSFVIELLDASDQFGEGEPVFFDWTEPLSHDGFELAISTDNECKNHMTVRFPFESKVELGPMPQGNYFLCIRGFDRYGGIFQLSKPFAFAVVGAGGVAAEDDPTNTDTTTAKDDDFDDHNHPDDPNTHTDPDQNGLYIFITANTDFSVSSQSVAVYFNIRGAGTGNDISYCIQSTPVLSGCDGKWTVAPGGVTDAMELQEILTIPENTPAGNYNFYAFVRQGTFIPSPTPFSISYDPGGSNSSDGIPSPLTILSANNGITNPGYYMDNFVDHSLSTHYPSGAISANMKGIYHLKWSSQNVDQGPINYDEVYVSYSSLGSASADCSIVHRKLGEGEEFGMIDYDTSYSKMVAYFDITNLIEPGYELSFCIRSVQGDQISSFYQYGPFPAVGLKDIYLEHDDRQFYDHIQVDTAELGSSQKVPIIIQVDSYDPGYDEFCVEDSAHSGHCSTETNWKSILMGSSPNTYTYQYPTEASGIGPSLHIKARKSSDPSNYILYTLPAVKVSNLAYIQAGGLSVIPGTNGFAGDSQFSFNLNMDEGSKVLPDNLRVYLLDPRPSMSFEQKCDPSAEPGYYKLLELGGPPAANFLQNINLGVSDGEEVYVYICGEISGQWFPLTPVEEVIAPDIPGHVMFYADQFYTVDYHYQSTRAKADQHCMDKADASSIGWLGSRSFRAILSDDFLPDGQMLSFGASDPIYDLNNNLLHSSYTGLFSNATYSSGSITDHNGTAISGGTRMAISGLNSLGKSTNNNGELEHAGLTCNNFSRAGFDADPSDSEVFSLGKVNTPGSYWADGNTFPSCQNYAIGDNGQRPGVYCISQEDAIAGRVSEFKAETGPGVDGDIKLTITFSSTEDIQHIKVMRVPGIQPPKWDCSEGIEIDDLVMTGLTIHHTDSGLMPGAHYSYRACVYSRDYDQNGNPDLVPYAGHYSLGGAQARGPITKGMVFASSRTYKMNDIFVDTNRISKLNTECAQMGQFINPNSAGWRALIHNPGPPAIGSGYDVFNTIANPVASTAGVFSAGFTQPVKYDEYGRNINMFAHLVATGMNADGTSSIPQHNCNNYMNGSDSFTLGSTTATHTGSFADSQISCLDSAQPLRIYCLYTP